MMPTNMEFTASRAARISSFSSDDNEEEEDDNNGQEEVVSSSKTSSRVSVNKGVITWIARESIICSLSRYVFAIIPNRNI